MQCHFSSTLGLWASWLPCVLPPLKLIDVRIDRITDAVTDVFGS